MLVSDELIDSVMDLTPGEMMALLGRWIGKNIPQVNYMTCLGHLGDGVPMLRLPVIPVPQTPSGRLPSLLPQPPAVF